MQLLVSVPWNALSVCMLPWDNTFTKVIQLCLSPTVVKCAKTMTEITGLTFLQLTPKAVK